MERSAEVNAAIQSLAWESVTNAQACCCMGPQYGQPLCPCQMQGVKQRDGRYVLETDLGPVPDGLILPTDRINMEKDGG